jgi:hypothetical protein
MRVLLLVSLGALVALALVASVPAQTNDAVGNLALKTLDANVGDAIKLELSALNLAGHGNVPGARQELQNSRSLLEGAFNAADTLTPPADLTKYVPDDSWERLGRNIRSAATEDEDALDKRGKIGTFFVSLALQKKDAIYKLVHPLASRPECSVLTNDQSGFEVNGAKITPGQFSVEVACTMPIKRIFVDTPKYDITETTPDGDAKMVMRKSPDIVEIVGDGNQAGVTAKANPDLAPGAPVDVIVIVGDATLYDPETM